MSSGSSSIDVLENIVSNAIRGGTLAKAIRQVRVEPDLDAQGNEILRVLIEMKRQPDNADEELENLLERIESAILAIDDRYPSVRFLDAA
ncbi:MAG TPA: hypothetical protein VN231_04935 [Allosphingosinicella sp.]|nr:hypothetical protein [Allosphingosinicella sp.]